ncbi:hypothetical protein WMY93_021649 [Mugilogobius chulae]|uniref:Uncharacterized protein n=1 Tax=Mugilogobius chulae TaxID=88201 RepID=A0AAW0NFX7_9GOBI
MNLICRSRLMVKDDLKRQREFFEKRKLQQRLKNLGLPLPSSSEESTSSSMDLVTLFIVNQISAKKESKDPPKVSVLGSGSKAVSKHRRNEPLVLPMSPLSPVLESAFSDNSASDYAPRATEGLSPFSTSSSSSAHGAEMFPMQLNQQQGGENQSEPVSLCSQAWGGSQSELDLFQAFALPRDMANSKPLLCPPDLSQLETPSAVQVQFGTPSQLETRRYVNPLVSSVLRDPSDNEVPVLDFSLNQQEYEQQPFEEDEFRNCSNGEFSAQVEGNVTSKIHLRNDKLFQPSKPQMVPETLCSKLLTSPNPSLSCPGNSSVILDEGQYSPRCFSSDSSDAVGEHVAYHIREEEESHTRPCLDTVSSAESHHKPMATLQQLRPFPPSNRRLKITDKVTTTVKEQHERQSTPDFFRSLPQTQCQCCKKRTETREMETQTDSIIDTSDKCDTATQCSLIQAPVKRPSVLKLHFPHAAPSPLSTRGQTVFAVDKLSEEVFDSPGTAGEQRRTLESDDAPEKASVKNKELQCD